jgi:hypothetical protein
MLEALGNRFQFIASLLQSGSAFQARDGTDAGVPTAIVWQIVRPRFQRQVDIRGLYDLEAGGENADYRVGIIVERE